MVLEDRGQRLVPAVIFSLKKSQENLFFCLEVIVDRWTGKRYDAADFLQCNLLKAQGLIQLLAGVDDLFPPPGYQLRRSFDHSVLLSALMLC